MGRERKDRRPTMTEHKPESCALPRVKRKYQNRPVVCPTCHRVFLAVDIGGWGQTFWTWKEIGRFDD